MPPRIHTHHLHQPVETPKPKEQPKPQTIQNRQIGQNDASATTRTTDLFQFGQQQRDRVERFYGAGVGASGGTNDIRLNVATLKADNARANTFNSELAALKTYESNVKAGVDVSGYTGAKTFTEVVGRADNAYRAELQKQGFTPADTRGTSVIKAADFFNSEANRGGSLSTLSADQIRLRVQNGDAPNYVVRLVQNNRMESSGATLAAPSRAQAWVASADELAGAKNDLFEVMRRIGYKESDVQSARADILAGRAKPSDWSLAIIETNGTRGRTTPLWDTMIGNAKSNTSFAGFDLSNPDFVSKVRNFEFGGMNYDAHRELMGRSDADVYIAKTKLPPTEAEAFKARFQFENEYGANSLFTGDGTTLRPDLQNGRVGGREWMVDNLPLRDQQRTTFVPLRDANLGDAPAVETRSRVSNVVENPMRLGMETRNGALIGAGFSTAMSLPQVFDQVGRRDFAGAGETLATNAGTGFVVGGTSAVVDRFASNGAEQVLSRSGTMTQLSESLYSNGATRNVVQKLWGAETVATTQAFGGFTRQIASKAVGGSIVGGLVNGAFASYDQIGAYNRGEVTGSQAVGTVVGEVGVGLAAGATGAAAGAAIGSIVPIAGTAVGAVVGFVVGVGVGMVTDAALRYGGVDKMIAHGVTAAIDKSAEFIGQAGDAVSNAANEVADGVKNMASGAVHNLASIFG